MVSLGFFSFFVLCVIVSLSGESIIIGIILWNIIIIFLNVICLAIVFCRYFERSVCSER